MNRGTPRVLSRPAPGFFLVRLVKKGAPTPARIFRPDPVDPDTGEPIDRWPPLQVQVGTGLPTHDSAEVAKVWEYGREIPEDEYRYRVALMGYKERHEPGSPEANPHRAADPRRLPPAF